MRAGSLNVAKVSVVLAVVAGLFVPVIVTGPYYLGLVNIALIYALLVSGFNFTLGYTGRISLGHIGFWGLGAYTSGLLTTDGGVSVPVAMVAGAIVAAVAAFILGRLTSRLSTHYLALATLGFGEIVRLVLLNWQEVTHGTNGVIGIPRFKVINLEIQSDFQLFYVLYGFALLGILVSWRFATTRLGREALVMKQSELAAESIGIRTGRVKVLTVVISAIYAAIAGSLYAHTFGFLSPDVFSFSEMITVVAMLIVGGQGTVAGPVLGGILLTFLPEWFREADEYWQLFYGIGVLLLVVRMPYGLAGLARRLLERIGVLSAGLGGAGAAADLGGGSQEPGVVVVEDVKS